MPSRVVRVTFRLTHVNITRGPLEFKRQRDKPVFNSITDSYDFIVPLGMPFADDDNQPERDAASRLHGRLCLPKKGEEERMDRALRAAVVMRDGGQWAAVRRTVDELCREGVDVCILAPAAEAPCGNIADPLSAAVASIPETVACFTNRETAAGGPETTRRAVHFASVEHMAAMLKQADIVIPF